MEKNPLKQNSNISTWYQFGWLKMGGLMFLIGFVTLTGFEHIVKETKFGYDSIQDRRVKLRYWSDSLYLTTTNISYPFPCPPGGQDEM